MGKNRDRISIIAAILKTADLGLSKTRIMFAANLSFKLLEKYLGIVTSAGLIRPEGSTYRLTVKGRKFLSRYKSFQQRYAEAQKMLETLGNEHDELSRLCEKNLVDPISLTAYIKQTEN